MDDPFPYESMGFEVMRFLINIGKLAKKHSQEVYAYWKVTAPKPQII